MVPVLEAEFELEQVMSEAFERVLDHFGVDYRTNGRSFIFKDCPSCGRNSNTVWLFRPEEGSTRTGGQCWVCGEKFSSYTYLTMLGLEPEEVRNELGIGRRSIDLDPESWHLPDFMVEPKAITKEKTEIVEAEWPEHFFKVNDWPSSTASKYARSRGVCGTIGNTVYVDPNSNSVAFQITAHGKHVGFQKRYTSPSAPFKTKTDSGIPKSRSFINIGSRDQPICVVEGPFDAVSACWFGYYGVCTMGASISRTQAQELAMMAFNQNPDDPVVNIALDNDEPGEQGARYLARLLDSYGVKFKRVTPAGEFKDLNDALVQGTGIDFSGTDHFFNVGGMVKEDTDWHWSTNVLDGFRYKIGIDYSWKDFRVDPSEKAKQRQKALNKLKREDPEKYLEVQQKIQEKEQKRQKRLKLEGIL